MRIPHALSVLPLLWPGFLASHGLDHEPDVTTLPPPVVTPVMVTVLPDQPGKEALMLLVEYPPGGGDPVHRHDAHGFIYVLEGSIVMGVAGGAEITLGPGQTFHEGPHDLHTVGRNASQVERARFLVLLLKDIGKPAVLPAS